MTWNSEHSAAAIVALAIFAHAWSGRIIAPPAVLSVIGWIVNVLAMIALLSMWVRF